MQNEFIVLVISYFLGSIPFGFLLVKFSQGKDIRSIGNIGATNVFRKNRATEILTLLLDAGKGALAVAVAGWLGVSPTWMAVAAVAAIIGHIFPVWLRFKGGKGVATGCGAFLVLSPIAVLSTLVLFVLVGYDTLCFRSFHYSYGHVPGLGLYLRRDNSRPYLGCDWGIADCGQASPEYPAAFRGD